MIVRTGETFALKKISCMEGVQVESSVRATMEEVSSIFHFFLTCASWRMAGNECISYIHVP